ncbi:MAG: hypothetical protein H0V17_12985, partial [Deltaproteobacteria bacterium]|nr:hypothetical protein [Deltaproteobacteria bacterium]
MRRYHSIAELIAKLDEPNRTACARILDEHRTLFETVKGGNNHHVWRGGYLDHVTDAMNLAVVLHEELGALRSLPFSLSDLLLVIYLHDLEKPWRFGDRKEQLAAKESHEGF